ncbi:MAG: prolipoprotein diacylglyceryl transferase [Ruminococcaceae bacterium]|nr:prolipoprotein diacylglyceryl transferase [Oscillospiraceae bacterium]
MDKYLAFYYGFIGLGFLFGTAYLFSVRKKYDIKKKEALLSALTGLCASLFGAILMAYLYNEIILFASGGEVQAASRFRLFGILLFSPFLIKGMYAIAKKDVDVQLDLYAVGTVAALGFAKIGCFSYGCCYGIVCEHGIVNRLTLQTVFPVQLAEAFFCFALAGVLMWFMHRKKCVGLLFPIAQIAYSVPRFFLEFLRHYDFAVEGDIFLQLSVWQWFSVLTILVGILWLVFAKKKRA